uniref:Uncharacterized protein n=1 Tax=Solanum lycopersicum TaxID=4081 RepID=A0A3Q7IE85_SOLLC
MYLFLPLWATTGLHIHFHLNPKYYSSNFSLIPSLGLDGGCDESTSLRIRFEVSLIGYLSGDSDYEMAIQRLLCNLALLDDIIKLKRFEPLILISLIEILMHINTNGPMGARVPRTFGIFGLLICRLHKLKKIIQHQFSCYKIARPIVILSKDHVTKLTEQTTPNFNSNFTSLPWEELNSIIASDETSLYVSMQQQSTMSSTEDKVQQELHYRSPAFRLAVIPFPKVLTKPPGSRILRYRRKRFLATIKIIVGRA